MNVYVIPKKKSRTHVPKIIHVLTIFMWWTNPFRVVFTLTVALSKTRHLPVRNGLIPPRRTWWVWSVPANGFRNTRTVSWIFTCWRRRRSRVAVIMITPLWHPSFNWRRRRRRRRRRRFLFVTQLSFATGNGWSELGRDLVNFVGQILHCFGQVFPFVYLGCHTLQLLDLVW